MTPPGDSRAWGITGLAAKPLACGIQPAYNGMASAVFPSFPQHLYRAFDFCLTSGHYITDGSFRFTETVGTVLFVSRNGGDGSFRFTETVGTVLFVSDLFASCPSAWPGIIPTFRASGKKAKAPAEPL